MITALLRRIGAFVRAREAVAAVELALIVPLMLFLYVGSSELSQLITVDRRVNTIAGAVGDLVARSNGTIATATLTDYFKAAEEIIWPYPTGPLKQVVTCVFVAKDGKVTVRWSEKYGTGAVAYTAGTAYPLPVEMKNVALGQYVIVSEATYAYTPLLGIVFQNAVPLARQNFYLPRFGEEIKRTS